MNSKHNNFNSPDPESSDIEELDSDLDYFVILSAYIDGEASVAECQQVQAWLDQDPEIKKVYCQLLSLQGGMQNSAIPSQDVAFELDTSQKVFARLDRSRNLRRIFLGTGAIAATVVGVFVNVIPNPFVPSMRLADNNSFDADISQPFEVAVSLNEPTVIIPKTAISNFDN